MQKQSIEQFLKKLKELDPDPKRAGQMIAAQFFNKRDVGKALSEFGTCFLNEMMRLASTGRNRSQLEIVANAMAGHVGALIAITAELARVIDQERAEAHKNKSRPPRSSLPPIREGALF